MIQCLLLSVPSMEPISNSTEFYFDLTETPTEAPSSNPTQTPTSVPISQSPSSIFVITFETPLYVPYYETSSTGSATINTVPYTFTVCSAGDLHISDCGAERCQDGGSNDQYIRLYSNGLEVAYSDDACFLCAAIDYPIVADTCQTYIIQQGCSESNDCSGAFVITLTSFQTQGKLSVIFFLNIV